MEATMHEAKTQLSKLVKTAISGEEVILTSGQKRIPVARIVPIDSASPLGEISAAEALKKGERPLGLYKASSRSDPNSLNLCLKKSSHFGNTAKTTMSCSVRHETPA